MPATYHQLKEYQKINHFPNSGELTNKARLSANFMKQRLKHGPEECNYIPETYELPGQILEFKAAFKQNKNYLKRNSDEDETAKGQQPRRANSKNLANFSSRT
jgi:hypothetical protein